jgi:hypothetical protein
MFFIIISSFQKRKKKHYFLFRLFKSYFTSNIKKEHGDSLLDVLLRAHQKPIRDFFIFTVKVFLD